MDVQVRLERQNAASHFLASNGSGNRVAIDGSPAVGGEGLGMRPMELALTALAACATMDVRPILEKQRQSLDDIRVTATGTRHEGTPSPFRAINLHFELWGDIDTDRANRALDLAVFKYCSVGAMFACSVELTWTLTLHGRKAA